MRVILHANRVADPLRTMTGIGRYIEEVVVRLPGLSPDGTDYVLSAPREDRGPQWLPTGVRYLPLPGSRKSLNLRWTVMGRPGLDHLVGPFDLVHALHPSYPVPAGRRPAVLTVHDLLPLEHPEWSPWDERVGFSRSIRRALDAGWVVAVDSDYVGGQVKAIPGADPSRIITVHLGVGPEFSVPVDAPARRRICDLHGLVDGGFLLCVGALNRRKNLKVVIEALRRLGPGGPQVAVAGGSGRGRLEVSEEADLRGRLRLLGFVPDDQLVALLQASRGLLHPSTTEGFGLTVLEAQAAGAPVIASNGGSLPEIVGETGILLDPADADAWAASMVQVVSDDVLWDRLRATGRAHAASFTWEKTALGTLRAHQLARSLS